MKCLSIIEPPSFYEPCLESIIKESVCGNKKNIVFNVEDIYSQEIKFGVEPPPTSLYSQENQST